VLTVSTAADAKHKTLPAPVEIADITDTWLYAMVIVGDMRVYISRRLGLIYAYIALTSDASFREAVLRL